MRSLLSASAVFGTAVLFTGCASLFASGAETVRIESEPAGATVTAQNGHTLGVTPLITTLEPKNYVLQFSHPGYSPASYALSRKVDGIAYLNLLCLLCWGIDFATGAVWGLEEEFVKVTLTPQNASAGQDFRTLACANYAALSKTAARGIIDFAALQRGRSLVETATGVPASRCDPDTPLLQ